MSFRVSAVKFLEGFARGICNKKKGAQKRLGQYSKRSQVGLYVGKDIRFGNSVSFSNKKHRRSFKPNVQKKALWSVTLNKWIKFHITTKGIRCVDKAGGLDNYLLKMKHSWMNSKEGSRAKDEIEEAISLRQQLDVAAQEAADQLDEPAKLAKEGAAASAT